MAGTAQALNNQRSRSYTEYYFLSEAVDSDSGGFSYSAGDASDKSTESGRRIIQSGIQVVRFHVWQDLTSGVEDGVAPLHATVTFDMTYEWYACLSNPCGTIKIEGLHSEGFIQAKLMINQAHYGLGLSQPGSRQIQFVMSPTPMYVRLDASEVVHGSVRMKFGDRQLNIKLPATKVIFTR
jgi:hypothetical protein